LNSKTVITKTKQYLKIVAVLLLVDWVLGAAHANHLVPPWTFLLANFPFGAIFVWLESHWTGNQYRIGDQVVSEMWPFVSFFATVFAQAWLYYLLFGLWRKRPSDANPPDKATVN
jgi:hypothetical protein